MVITTSKHNKILHDLKETHQKQLDEINDIIENHEKQIESLTDRVVEMAKRAENAKRGANETLELLDYSSEDSVIPSIVNFLNEQGNAEAAKIIGKCKLGKVNIEMHDNPNWPQNQVHIPIFCTGDAYNVLSYSNTTKTTQIEKAFETFYSKYYIEHSTNMEFLPNVSFWYNLDLTMKHIEPKESDLEQFFEKVKKLKKLIGNK